MRRAFALLVSLATLGACSSSPNAGPVVDAGVLSEPAIWLQPSSSIDPTKLPLCDQCYTGVTDGGPPKKG